MSKFIRNLVFYLLIVIVGVWIYDYYNASSTPKNEMSYSNFIKEVQQAVEIKIDSLNRAHEDSLALEKAIVALDGEAVTPGGENE